MKKKGAVHIGLAAALYGSSALIGGGYQISAIIAAVLLTISAGILFADGQFTGSAWRRLVKICSKIDITYAAFGLGISGAGINLLQPGILPFGVLFLLAGAFIIGLGIGKNVEEFAASLILRFRLQGLN
jgi:hypothetical protein